MTRLEIQEISPSPKQSIYRLPTLLRSTLARRMDTQQRLSTAVVDMEKAHLTHGLTKTMGLFEFSARCDKPYTHGALLPPMNMFSKFEHRCCLSGTTCKIRIES